MTKRHKAGIIALVEETNMSQRQLLPRFFDALVSCCCWHSQQKVTRPSRTEAPFLATVAAVTVFRSVVVIDSFLLFVEERELDSAMIVLPGTTIISDTF
jgi:hypothetical protein